MADSNLQIVITLEGADRVVKASVIQGGFLPADIFVYQNTSAGLGEYWGVCNKDELQRMKVFRESSPLPVFGNKFVRYHEAKHVMSPGGDVDTFVTTLSKDVQTLSTALQTTPSITKIVKIT